MIENMILFVAIALTDSVSQTVSGHAIVIDAETNTRIKDAKVVVDGGVAETKTIWDGAFSVNMPFKQLWISKRGYLTRKMNYEEWTDTITLLNNLMNIDEVVVWGRRPAIQWNLNQKAHGFTSGGAKQSGIDILGLLEHLFHAKKYKRKKR